MNTDIHYTGKLKVSIAKKNTIIDTKYYENSGTINLFSFVGKCLAGDYASDRRPQYIHAFSAGDEGESIPEDVSTVLGDTTKSKSDSILYSIPPRAYMDGEGLSSSYKVVYKFNVLLTQLTNTDNINMFALYSDTNKTENTQPSAYFYITDPNDPTKLGKISIEGDTALIIEWIMTISN